MPSPVKPALADLKVRTDDEAATTEAALADLPTRVQVLIVGALLQLPNDFERRRMLRWALERFDQEPRPRPSFPIKSEHNGDTGPIATIHADSPNARTARNPGRR